MTNEAINPNGFLECFFADTFLVKDIVTCADTDITGLIRFTGLYDKFSNSFTAPNERIAHIPLNTKRINLRVFEPENINYGGKFVANYNFDVKKSFGPPNDIPRLFLLNGSELEIYSTDEMKKLAMMVHFTTRNPFFLSISLFK